jgi:glutaredoxin
MYSTSPNALLFVAPGCPHCATVLQGLNELIKEKLIGKLTVIDATTHPEQAEEHEVRSAPWLRLGPFTLTGAHTPAELRQWAEWASGDTGTAHYVEHLLKQGGYQQAKAFVDIDTHRLKPLLGIVADPSAKLEVRLGVSALLEAHANSPSLQNLLPHLSELSRHADHRVRADACYLLGLTGSAAARTDVEACLGDTHHEVQEIAAEALEKLPQKKPKS